mmetsp:Transcript_1782/g.3148  ORF Transcript_1782/g.3148 Transcript_1782/m.3148 type:complete len:191 (+) Transcript_1782:26-598(+)
MLGCHGFLRPCPAWTDGHSCCLRPQRAGEGCRMPRPSGTPASILAGLGMMINVARRSLRRSQEVSDDFPTSRIRLWRMLTSGEYHTLSSLAQGTSLSIQEVRHHLEHVIKQARSLKNKSPEWRARRSIPADWDVSSVRVQVLPSACERCTWEAKNAAKKIVSVKVCKKCGSRAMSPVIVSLECQKLQGSG